ncbi:SpoIIE family protein phosphatase [Streptomyces sp. N1]|uniref:SpoIIE family protein phosphatase n=1 Tax=Streptomyces sp. N1 TaxID=576456 RepID=UPI0019D6EBCC|nr:SpoIIE family protein phosphatase [Streptomyces sp. N1]
MRTSRGRRDRASARASWRVCTDGFPAGSRLLLYTDGLVETRTDPIDERLQLLRRLLTGPPQQLEATCDHLLDQMRHPGSPDDVAFILADLKHDRSRTSHQDTAE